MMLEQHIHDTTCYDPRGRLPTSDAAEAMQEQHRCNKTWSEWSTPCSTPDATELVMSNTDEQPQICRAFGNQFQLPEWCVVRYTFVEAILPTCTEVSSRAISTPPHRF